ncbi:unnamed protein product [Ambrosiozyma monospora]|uniref:Unnamed protein product n=1 Tax=Ambrosiozyma monospora TaxID=43982 RepID=A0ACB5TJG3_AMBMO|nr:unnamed protein product [Ambrosiozyma monospora]
MFHVVKVPVRLCLKAAIHSVYFRKHLFNRKLGTSPVSMTGYSQPLDVNKLRVFGEKCVVTLPPYEDKLDTRASVGVYLGYDHSTYGHPIFVPKNEGD